MWMSRFYSSNWHINHAGASLRGGYSGSGAGFLLYPHTALFRDKQEPAGAQLLPSERTKSTGSFLPPCIKLCSSQAQWSERKDRRLCGLRPAAADTVTAQDILLFRQREMSFFKAMNPCVPAWGVHTVLWAGFELTQVTVAPSLAWRRRGWIIQAAGFGGLWRLVVLLGR